MATLQIHSPQSREASHSPLSEASFHSPRLRQTTGRSPTGPFLFRGRKYCSRSEAACGLLLEKYIEDFLLKEGSTYQVPISADKYGNLRTLDFLVAGVLLEFHPPRLWTRSSKCGDFNNYREYLDFRRTHEALPKDEQAEFRLETKETLARNYYLKRRRTLNENSLMRKMELVVVSSASELYDQIIHRFSNNKPSKDIFLAEFDALLDEVTDTRPIHCRPKRYRPAA